MHLSERAANITPSATLAIEEKARSLRKSGQEVISFATGEPDFDTPEDVKKEAQQAMKEGLTKYTSTGGIDELKEAIRIKFKQDNDLDYTASQIVACVGAKQAIYNALTVLCNPGDEVIVPRPCWVSYTEQIKLAGGKPVFVVSRQENSFIPSPADIEKAITGRTRVILINSPNNPTGAVYPAAMLSELIEIAKKHKLFVIADEVYEKLVYEDSKHVSIASLDPEIPEQTVVVNAVSKTYAMTGWRIGYAAGPKEIIGAMTKFQGHTTGNATSIAQRAAAYAIVNNFDYQDWLLHYNKRRKYCLEKINRIPGIESTNPQGAFYLFPDVSGLIGKVSAWGEIKSSLDVAAYLLDEAKVAVVPGEAFEAPNCIRLSYATSMGNIIKGIGNIERALKKLT